MTCYPESFLFEKEMYSMFPMKATQVYLYCTFKQQGNSNIKYMEYTYMEKRTVWAI